MKHDDLKSSEDMEGQHGIGRGASSIGSIYVAFLFDIPVAFIWHFIEADH
jgi:hypothetical protein